MENGKINITDTSVVGVIDGVDVESLKNEFKTIMTSFENDSATSSKVVDLGDISALLLEVKEKLSELKTDENYFTRVLKKVPIVNKITGAISNEMTLNQSIYDYINDTIKKFDSKYDELYEHLKSFHRMKELYENKIITLNNYIEKLKSLNSSDQYVKRLITESKSEVLRINNSLNTIVVPSISAANGLCDTINELTPILKNMLIHELRTAAGIQSFKTASQMLHSIKSTILEINKINSIASSEAIISIIENTKSNLMKKEDLQELEKLQKDSYNNILKVASEVKKGSELYSEYVNEQYNKHIKMIEGTVKTSQLIDKKDI